MAVEEPSQTTNDARRSQQARARARPPDLTERLNIFAKAVGLGVLIALIGVGAFGRFYNARFNGLVSTTAMEIGDIAQQLRVGHGMSTKVIRPLALAYGQPNEEGVMPDMLHAPLYPYLLSLLFRVRGSGDASIALFNGLMFLLTGWLIYSICRLVWDRTVALLSVVVFFISVDAIGQALTGAGASLAGLLFTMAIWAALRGRLAPAGTNKGSPQGNRALVIWPAMAAAIFGLACLAGLTSLLLFIPLAILATAAGRGRWRQIGVMVAVLAVVLAPWAMRNWRVSGTVMPALAGYEIITHTQSYPGETIFQQMPGQAPSALSFVVQHPGEIWNKVARGLTLVYRAGPRILNPYLFPFFILGAFLFGDATLSRRLWRVVVAMFILQALSICLYRLEINGIGVLLPIGMCLAVAGLVAGLRSTQASRRAQVAIGVVIVGLALFPTVSSAILGKKMPSSRMQGSLQLMREGLADDAVIVTDDPAGVASYAYKTAVLLPSGPEGLDTLRRRGITPDYVYLSSAIGATIPRAAFEPWAKLLQSEDAPKRLGKALPLPGREILFQLVDKRKGAGKP